MKFACPSPPILWVWDKQPRAALPAARVTGAALNAPLICPEGGATQRSKEYETRIY